MLSAHCTSRRMRLSKATVRSQPISFLFTNRSAVDGRTWSLPHSHWHKASLAQNSCLNDEPDDPIPHFTLRYPARKSGSENIQNHENTEPEKQNALGLMGRTSSSQQ